MLEELYAGSGRDNFDTEAMSESASAIAYPSIS